MAKSYLGFFSKYQPNEIIFEKLGSVTFEPLWTSNCLFKNDQENHFSLISYKILMSQKKFGQEFRNPLFKNEQENHFSLIT